MSAIDLDEVFSYQTTKEVRMLDRRLGMVCWLIRAVVIFYVVGYVFLLREGYTETEKSVGHVISSVNGSTYSTVSQSNNHHRPWDAVDVATPSLENGAVFVGTTIYTTGQQYIDNASNLLLSCTPESELANCGPPDLPLNQGKCVSGYCVQLLWTPSYSPNDQHTHKNEMETADQLGVWLRSMIVFPTLDEARTFSTIAANEEPVPYNGGKGGVTVTEDSETSGTIGDGSSAIPDYFTIGELLTLAGTSYTTIKPTGCTLSIQFYWSCFVDGSSCYPKMKVARLDTNEKRRGFDYQYAHYYRGVSPKPEDNGKTIDLRDLYTAHGVRLLLTSQGEGKKVSLSAIILQISAGIALLWLAGFVADFLMLYVLPERKHYRTYKQERTPDFSDLRNKIAEVEGEKKKLRDRKNRFAAKLDES